VSAPIQHRRIERAQRAARCLPDAGNTFGSKTGGASLAFDEPAGEIILCARLEDMVVGADALKNYLERFAAAAKYWVAEYEMHARTSARAAAPQNAVAFRRDWQLLAGRV
jgi:hypothetical protein